MDLPDAADCGAMERRTVLAVTAGVIPALAGCSGGGGAAGEYGDWFSNVDNFEGELDRTGEDRVSVQVGADDGFAFAPAAIQVDPGTTVVWTWTGDGGRHNVVERDGVFSSPYHDEEGATFEWTFDSAGLFPYVCEPHEGMGMKGGVRVV
jgi:halocyanin-like protein